MDNKQTGVNVYTYLSHVQSLCSQYLHTKTRLIQLDSDLQKRSLDLDALPNYQNLSAVNEAWNQKFSIMGMMPQIIDNTPQLQLLTYKNIYKQLLLLHNPA